MHCLITCGPQEESLLFWQQLLGILFTMNTINLMCSSGTHKSLYYVPGGNFTQSTLCDWELNRKGLKISFAVFQLRCFWRRFCSACKWKRTGHKLQTATQQKTMFLVLFTVCNPKVTSESRHNVTDSFSVSTMLQWIPEHTKWNIL